MKKTGFIIAIACCAAVIAAGTIVIVNRNNSSPSGIAASETESRNTVFSDGIAVIAAENEATNAEKAAAGSSAMKSEQKPAANGTEGPEKQQPEGFPEAGENILQGVTPKEPSPDSPLLSKGEDPLEKAELKEIELPAETDIPEDWDWKTFPTQNPQKGSSATSPFDGGSSSGKDNTEKSSEPESSAPQGEQEGQSAEENSTQESGSEEQSSEESSTEETETETTTLSPEDQASIVESATAPIELPPIFPD